MIPKVIHYCWFGNNPKPAIFEKCSRSWKRYCPDYEIIEWNEENFDINCNEYVREAYDAGKWAFVTDYARLWIVSNYGGIYLDTDVELVKSLDCLLEEACFLGYEDEECVATGLGFGAEKGNSIINLMLQDYDTIHFKRADGSYDLTTCPVRNTNSIAHLILENRTIGKINRIKDAVLYPPEYFCPLSPDGTTMNRTNNTYSIHWYSATWLTNDEKIVHEYRMFRAKCERIFGKWMGGYIARSIYLLFPDKREILKRM